MATKTATPKSTTTKAPAKPATPKAAPAQTATLAQAAAQGQVVFYRMRCNQTLRHLPYLAPGTKARAQAETVAKRHEAGDTIGTIAGDLKVSVATVRRMITGLLLAEQIEAGTYDAKWHGGRKVVVGQVGDKEEAAAA